MEFQWKILIGNTLKFKFIFTSQVAYVYIIHFPFANGTCNKTKNMEDYVKCIYCRYSQSIRVHFLVGWYATKRDLLPIKAFLLTEHSFINCVTASIV